MIITCEKCEKKYRIDPEKIKGDQARFKCNLCENIITVKKPSPSTQEPPVAVEPGPPPPPPSEPEPRPAEPDIASISVLPKSKGRIMGLTAKFMLFILLPLLIIYALSILFSILNMSRTQEVTIDESLKMVTNMSEKAIAAHARSVAEQVRLYLISQPDLQKQAYNNDKEFRKVAVQKVGKTGYSALYELPDQNGVWRTWAHANPKIIGIDMSSLKKPMGKSFPGFWKVFSGVRDGKESKGYYTWQDADGAFRDKFMVCTPVKGTRYIIASTTYLDEFTKPVVNLEETTEELGKKAQVTNAVIMGIGLVVVGLILFLYGRTLTGKVRHLSEVADRICVGQLDAQVKEMGKDEIGELAQSIVRMRDSIRVSIERMRRKRKR
jgi:predicted Zn finger-like uncharacterized protein